MKCVHGCPVLEKKPLKYHVTVSHGKILNDSWSILAALFKGLYTCPPLAPFWKQRRPWWWSGISSKKKISLDTWCYIYIYNSTHWYTAQIWSKKLSMYVGPHNVYPTIDVNFSILTREGKNKKLVDNIFSSNFVLLSMCWIIKLL